MSIRKNDLYDFIEKKADKLRTDIKEKYQKISERIIDNALELFKPLLDDLEEHYVAIALKADDLYDLIEEHTSWPDQILRDFKNNSSLRKIIKHSMGDKYYIYAGKRELSVPKDCPDGVKAIRNAYNRALMTFNKELNEVNTLAKELKNVVRQSSSGKKALENLEKAGLDMTDFKAETPQNLPAVITTSVDIDLFNKKK